MATRFPPTFSITQGLLSSSSDMTPEEEERLLQEQLYGLDLSEFEPPPDDDAVDPADEPYPTETNDRLAPLPEDQEALPPKDAPLVIDAEPVATGLLRQPSPLVNGVDPLAPLPEREALKPEAKTEPKKIERQSPPKGQPLVKEVEKGRPEEPPLVIDATADPNEGYTAGSNWVARHSEEAKRLIAQQKKNNKNVEVSPEKAAYAQQFEGVVNEMLAEGANASEIMNAGQKLATEVYGDSSFANWDKNTIDAVVRDFDARVERGGTIPRYQVDPDGQITDKEAEDPTIRQSAAAGAASSLAALQSSIEAVKEATGIGDPSANAKSRQYWNGVSGAFPEGTAFKDIKGFGDALKWAQVAALKNASNLSLSLSGGLIGGAIKGSLGAQVGAFGTSYALELGSVQSANKQIDPDQKAGLATFLSAGAAATLDSILPGKVGAQLAGRLGKEAADDIAMKFLLMPTTREQVAAMAKRGLIGGAQGAATEAGTEFWQNIFEEIGTSYETGTPLQPGVFERAIEAAATGAVLGGPAGAVGQISEDRQAISAPIGEMAGAQFDTSGAVVGAQSPSQRAGAIIGTPSGPVATTSARPVVPTADEKPDRPLVVSATPEPVSKDGAAQKFQIPSGRVTSKFGPRQTFRTSNGQMASSNHAGIDIALPSGAPAPVGADGVVVFAGKKGGYGNQVVVMHSDGTTSSYSHLSKINAEVGEQVAQGQVIGKVGKTGNATGPHLHLERRDRQGRAINPLTGGAVVTLRDANGRWTDNTDWEADQSEVDNFYDDMLDQQEAENNFTEATGQQFEQEVEAPEQAEPDITNITNPTIARGAEAVATPAPEPTIRRNTRMEDAVASVVAGPSAADISIARGAELEAKKASSPARQALASLQTPERDADLSQPQIGEEPVFTDNTGTEVTGFINSETGAFRAIGEPVTMATAQPDETAPTAPAGPTPESTIPQEAAPAELPPVEAVPVQEPIQEAPQQAEPQPLAATTEELEIERKQRLLDALPQPPATASIDAREGRASGQSVGLGLQAEPTDLATQNKSFKTAYNLGLKEGQKALATNGTEVPVGKPLVKVAIPTAPNRQAAAPAKVSRKRQAEIEAKTDKIEEKLFDLETDGSKTAVRVYMQRLIKDGVLPADEVTSLSYMFKDRDMGVEDITSEIRTSVQLWAERELSAKPEPKEAAKKPVKQQRAAPKEDNTDDQTARAERGRPEVNDRRSPEVDEGTGERLRPAVNRDGTYTLQHYGAEGLTETDPTLWGRSKSLSSAERAYIEKAPPRTYFGIHTGEPGGYKNEFGAGVSAYEARIPAEKMYDVIADPDNLWVRGRPERGERAIKEAGYAGYWYKNNELGLVAVVFDKVPVKSLGKTEARPVKQSVRVSARVPDQIAANATAKVMAVLKQAALDGHPNMTVKIVDSLEGALGDYNPETFLIRVAAMAGYDVRLTARHEVMHWALDNVFDATEAKAMLRWAENHPGLMNWAKAYYPHLSRNEQIEEALAEGFSRWKGGDLMAITADDGVVAKLFEKLLRVLAAVRNAFSGAGITRGQINEVAQLFSDLESGRQAKKAEARKKPTTVTFGKRRTSYTESLAREMLAGNISPEQREFLAENRGDVKLQSAWHGTPNENIDQFKLQFIGTGEGAQAFGWGLYFAQRQEVAEWYRKKLVIGGRDPVDIALEVEGETMRSYFVGLGGYDSMAVYEVADRAINFLSQHRPYNGWLDAMWAEFDRDIENWVAAVSNPDEGVSIKEAREEADALRMSQRNVGDVFKTLIARGQNGIRTSIRFKEVQGGKLYKVEVPENNELIFLDKKLGDQPEQVKAALDKIRGHLSKANMLDHYEDRFGDFDDWTGLELTRVVLPNMAYGNAFPDEVSDELENALVNGHAAMATSIWLRDLGVKGARYLDRDSRAGNDGAPTTNFVIFDDGAIQLKAKQSVIRTPMANSPLSDPTQPNPGVFRRIHDQTMGLLGALAGKDVDAADNLVDAFRRKVTQRYQQVIKTQDRASQLLGVDRLPSGQNPMEMITADERGYKLQFLTDNMIRPMATEMSRRGVSMDDLGLFLYARHAPARNARIAKINPEFRNPANPGSGMTDAEAMQIMADFQNDGKLGDLQSVATHIDQMIDMAQQERLNSGLINQSDIAAGFQPGDYYVPLRGNESIEPELEMDFTLAARKGGGFSISGKEGHRMFGRQSKADLEDIVGYTITQAQEAIDRGYRNRVAQSMLGMFRATPDSDFVQIDRVKRVSVWNKKKGQVEYQMQTRVSDPKEQQRTIYVKDGGHVTKMTFNDNNPSAMRFVKAAKNLGMSELPRILQLTSLFTRLWSKSNTQWNPDFILSNATKDVQTGVLNAKTLDVKGLRRSMLKNILSLRPLMATWMGATHEAGAGFNSASPWYQTYAEFEANGGKLNYGQIEPLEDAIKSAKREIKNAGGSRTHPIRVATDVLTFIDHLNSAFENMTRLAAYKALRDRGVEAKRAAEAVRELTTNFQQHGEWGPKFNAAYGFANASVIGGARFMKTVAKAPQVAGGLIALGMISDLLNSMGDDDEWDRYTEEDKHGNFIILMPESFGFDVKIPAGYGLNAFMTTGRKMSELWRGKKNKDGTRLSVLDAASDVGMGFINAFAPITGASFWNIVTPTVGDPVVNVYRNENNWGRPIMPTQPFRKEQQKSDSQLAFDNTSQFWKALATSVNALGGGNEVVPGWTPTDISPETYKHVTEETVGGAGRTFLRTINLIEKAATGQDVGMNDIPIVRRFAGNPYGAATLKSEQVGQFYERLGEARVVIAQAKEMVARYGKESETYQDYRADNKPIIEFAETVAEAEKRLRAYNTAENAAERGANRIHGLKRKDRKAIFKVTKMVIPSGRALTEDEVAKIKAKVKEKKERLALDFNDKYTTKVMGAK